VATDEGKSWRVEQPANQTKSLPTVCLSGPAFGVKAWACLVQAVGSEWAMHANARWGKGGERGELRRAQRGQAGDVGRGETKRAREWTAQHLGLARPHRSAPMSDLLLDVLPDFDARPFSHLLPSLDKCHIKTSDLLALDVADVAKRAQLPAGELRKLADAVVRALHRQLGFREREGEGEGEEEEEEEEKEEKEAEDFFLSSSDRPRAWSKGGVFISTLDEELDAALCGGIPPGYVVEITGERYGRQCPLLACGLSWQAMPS